MNYMKNQEKENEQLIKELDEHGLDPKQYFLMHKLAKTQDFRCIYSGEKISPSEYSLCEIDHIYPRTLGGNDALYNKVVCYKKTAQIQIVSALFLLYFISSRLIRNRPRRVRSRRAFRIPQTTPARQA